MTEWSDLNPLLQWCDTYEIVEISQAVGTRWTPENGTERIWTVFGEYIADWSDGPVPFSESYLTPNKASEVYHRIVRMARKVYFEYDQPPIGRLPQ